MSGLLAGWCDASFVTDASATLAQVISPNDRDAVAVLDGSRSSDPDHDLLSYEWFRSSVGTPLATGVLAVATLPVGTNLIELVVSDGCWRERIVLPSKS